ncbi:Putative rRNA methylase [Pelagirhabdus alkalitolerans]|uniref:rRNA methylase n=1 Tax=Pelagirhabdus alkalitolerans TaxID=1612202 RepID=A0A1G6LVJ7_9BACI|nr:class I SAM-dependent methyltransferase [Pelagirhabdus alkalitolerans]SDC47292.1 Putative rRNA methylase [Pelagirhabdus alkalitolerans]
MLKRVIPYAHEALKEVTGPGDIVIDATCGNGHDTVMLSEAVGVSGHVYACDLQQQAIDSTNEKLKELNTSNVSLIHDGHQHIQTYIDPDHIGQVAGAIFNLGYLPGSDKSVITTPDSTIQAVDSIFNLLRPSGRIVLVVYYGHPGGDIEKDALLSYLENLDQKEAQVLQYGFINQKNTPPFVLIIEKNSQSRH